MVDKNYIVKSAENFFWT